MSKKITGAHVLLDTLVSYGVTTIFGYPGGTNIPFYDVLKRDYPQIKHILVRNEQAAAIAAQGWARSTKEIAVCVTTSWPGAANALTGIMDAYMDSIPVLFITGQVVYNLLGNDAFQELDVTGATLSFTKHNYLVDSADKMENTMKEAINIAISGRPGPVHVDIPKDIFAQDVKNKSNGNWFNLPEEDSKTYQKVSSANIEKVVDLLSSAKRPVLLIGQGIKFANAEKALADFVAKTGIPTVSTLLAKGVLAENSEHYLGMLGMHGFYHANQAIYNADLILNIGSRFDDRIVGTYDTFGQFAKIVHVDIDKAELNKLVEVDLPINCSADIFLEKILENENLSALQIDNWQAMISKWKTEKPYLTSTEKLSVKNVYQQINQITADNLSDYIFVTDVGQHQMWAAQCIKVASTKHWLTSWGAGTMGFALPAAMGAALANPNKTVVALVGDGSIQMNIQELQTIKEHNLNIKIVLLNNNFLGMVRQWQEFFYDKNYSATPMTSPHFQKLADAYGIKWCLIDNQENLEQNLSDIFREKWPVLLECKVPEEDSVFPMVYPGKSLKETVTE